MQPDQRITKTLYARTIKVSTKTLLTYMKEFGIGSKFSTISDQDLDNITREVQQTRPGTGRRYLARHLASAGIKVERERIRKSLARADPIGQAIREKEAAERRDYRVPRPNASWHIDGHHKLIRWGIVIHGIVDGFCQTIVGLQANTNNKALTVLEVFAEAVESWGWPSRVRGDRGASCGEHQCVIPALNVCGLRLEAALHASGELSSIALNTFTGLMSRTPLTYGFFMYFSWTKSGKMLTFSPKSGTVIQYLEWDMRSLQKCAFEEEDDPLNRYDWGGKSEVEDGEEESESEWEDESYATINESCSAQYNHSPFKVPRHQDPFKGQPQLRADFLDSLERMNEVTVPRGWGVYDDEYPPGEGYPLNEEIPISGKKRGKKLKKSAAGSASSRSAKTSSKGKARAVPETFAFRKVFVFPDGCGRKKTKGDLEFVFKATSTGSKPTPSLAEFEKARQKRLAASCDMRDGPWLLPLDLEADDVLNFFEPFLPDLICYLRTLEDVPNPNFVPGESPEHQQFLPQLVPLISTGRRQLIISPGALDYPTPTFAEYLCRICPDRSKGRGFPRPW
ncbi:hypothetical protein PQX77_009155 [Marasmius sp. AFHP31]|nr:hypothetical protein PQX77_009155 [Marasmius sp. AFHP31]